MNTKLMMLSIVFSMVAFACQKHTNTKCLKVKVIRGTCAGIVVQVLNDDSIGEDGWVDMFNPGARYDNVFSASNACKVPSEFKVGDEFYITIAKPAATDCVHCAMYDAPPQVAYEVRNMGRLPCTDDVAR
jgi:hypothetical protein